MGMLALVLVGGLFGGGAGGAPSTSIPNCETTTTIGRSTEPAVCLELEVTKVVTGTAPPGTTFSVLVVCPEVAPMALPPADGPPVDKTLTFPEGGGTQTVLLDDDAVCTITETPPPGCTLVSIVPPQSTWNPPTPRHSR